MFFFCFKICWLIFWDASQFDGRKKNDFFIKKKHTIFAITVNCTPNNKHEFIFKKFEYWTKNWMGKKNQPKKTVQSLTAEVCIQNRWRQTIICYELIEWTNKKVQKPKASTEHKQHNQPKNYIYSSHKNEWIQQQKKHTATIKNSNIHMQICGKFTWLLPNKQGKTH